MDERGNILEKLGSTRQFRFRFKEALMEPYIILQGRKNDFITKQIEKKLRPYPSARSFFHLVLAAAFAISLLREGVNISARALPPFKPPLRCPSAFLGGVSSTSPVATSKMNLANRLASRGLLGLSVIFPIWGLNGRNANLVWLVHTVYRMDQVSK